VSLQIFSTGPCLGRSICATVTQKPNLGRALDACLRLVAVVAVPGNDHASCCRNAYAERNPSGLPSPVNRSPRPPTNVRYKMVFSADGKMTRETVGAGGSKSEGTWKLTKDGFCHHLERLPSPTAIASSPPGDNKWSVMKGTTAVATWTK